MWTKIKNLVGEIKNLYKKRVVFILSLFVLIIGVFFVFFLFNRKGDKIDPGTVAYPGSIPEALSPPPVLPSFLFPKNISLPKKANIYVLGGEDEDLVLSRFNKIALSLGFTEKPRVINDSSRKTFQIDQEGSSFSGNLLSGAFFYIGEGQLVFRGDSEKELADSAFLFLKENGLVSNINSSASIKYYDYVGAEMAPAQDPKFSDLISISFVPAVGGAPVVVAGATDGTCVFYIDKKTKRATRIDFMLPHINLSQKQTVLLKGLDEIKKTDLSSFVFYFFNKGDGQQHSNLDSSSMKMVEFNNVFLAYLSVFENNSLLRPIFALEGRAETVDGQEGTVRAFIPAAKQ
jgi:hypothetical protein